MQMLNLSSMLKPVHVYQSNNNDHDDKERVFYLHFILQRFHRSNVTLRSSCETREENKLVSKLKFLN